MSLKEIALSPGSACSSGSADASHVLQAIGIGDLAHSSVRFGLGRGTTAEEIDYVVERVAEEVTRLRAVR
jgi:cysteine desulfurase